MGGVAGWGRGGMAARGRTRARRERISVRVGRIGRVSLSGSVGLVGCRYAVGCEVRPDTHLGAGRPGAR